MYKLSHDVDDVDEDISGCGECSVKDVEDVAQIIL